MLDTNIYILNFNIFNLGINSPSGSTAGSLGDSTAGLVGVASGGLTILVLVGLKGVATGGRTAFVLVGLKGVASAVASVRDCLFGALGGGLVGRTKASGGL